jgi:chromosome segregation ATPase
MKKALTAAATAMQGRGKRTMVLYRREGAKSMGNELQERLDELMDIQIKREVLDDRLEELDVEWDDLETEIEKCRYKLGEIQEAELDWLRREYERSVL